MQHNVASTDAVGASSVSSFACVVLRSEPNTYGYNGDDGRKYSHAGNNLRQNSGTEYGPTYSTGDTVGAGLNLETQEIFFT